MEQIFEWQRLLMNDLPYIFLVEVLFRCLVMFIIALIALKMAGRRGVRQLSIFELVVIITLGSAAGDPMFYEDVGLLPAACVFLAILMFYRLITWAVSRYQRFENWMEGKAIYLIKDGRFSIKNFEKEALAIDEFFSELRLRNVDHLGQVRLAILETSGDISIFFYEDEEVRPGLPILPHEFDSRESKISSSGWHACTFCGHTANVKAPFAKNYECENCGKKEWLKARQNRRIA